MNIKQNEIIIEPGNRTPYKTVRISDQAEVIQLDHQRKGRRKIIKNLGAVTRAEF